MSIASTVSQAEIDTALERIAASEAYCYILRPGCAPLPGHGRGVRPLLQLLENSPETLRGVCDGAQAVITTVLLNSLSDSDYEKLREYFNDELTIAAKFARKYKGKTVKPEVVKVKKPSRFSTLRDQ